ncbi:9333_t:CDS:2 [Funneliformis caledonium]|uniref:9333_t:CDS:1 n=1 Tax=Funneliformis caledonium TaxID=1117310 RepID=A0A9N9EAK4_9GLOM|nr:9333_t:CDS:2 [Funneliformis caledonium]
MENKIKEEILDYISNNLSSIQFKSLRENEVEATDDEKLSVIKQTLRNDPALFLTRWGKFLPKNELEKFECLRNDYEVNWYLNKLLSTQNRNTISSSIASEPPIISRQLLPNSRHNKQILNRRFKYLTTKLDNTSYFSNEAMEMREPSLYEDYVVVNVENIEMEGNDSVTSAVNNEVPQISDEEKEQLRADLVDIMREKFMSGEDPDFDYDSVDFNEEYDDIYTQEQEIHEKYFDNEEPNDTEVENGTGEYDY